MTENREQRLNKIIVAATVTIGDALQTADSAGEGIILVCDSDRRLLGVVTDGDARRYLLRNQSLNIPVSKIMNRNFKSLSENEREVAYNILRKTKMNHIPILDMQGRVIDLVTSLDFVKTDTRLYDNKIVIMAGGKGDRLLPLTKIIPKPLIPVGDRTMVEMIIDTFRNSGFSEFYVIINYKKELIKSYFEENGLSEKVSLLEEREYLGTVGGLSLLKGMIDRTFILTNCDIMATIDYGLVLDWHKEHEADLTILGARKQVNVPYGVINTNTDNYVTALDEKPFYTFMVMTGIYIIEPSIFDHIPDSNFYNMDELISDVIAAGKKVTCYPMENGWFDIGQFDEYKLLLKHLGVLGA